jgi:hypothetical protein
MENLCTGGLIGGRIVALSKPGPVSDWHARGIAVTDRRLGELVAREKCDRSNVNGREFRNCRTGCLTLRPPSIPKDGATPIHADWFPEVMTGKVTDVFRATRDYGAAGLPRSSLGTGREGNDRGPA